MWRSTAVPKKPSPMDPRHFCPISTLTSWATFAAWSKSWTRRSRREGSIVKSQKSSVRPDDNGVSPAFLLLTFHVLLLTLLMRTPFIAGNWKMFTTAAVAQQLAATVARAIGTENRVAVALCPPFPYLSRVAEVLRGTTV